MKRAETIRLTIPNPCSQRWDEMAHTDTGRLCKHCDKAVIDFTRFSDQQIKDFFSTTSTRVCGRFAPNQIDRIMVEKRDSMMPYVPALFAGAALAISVLTEGEAKVRAAKQVDVQAHTTSDFGLNDSPILPVDSLPTISGQVIDTESQEVLPGIFIVLKGTPYRTVTDVSGHFVLKIPDSVVGNNFVLVCVGIGFQKTEQNISRRDLPLNIRVSLSPDTSFLGEVVVVPKKSFWERLPKIKSPR